MQNQVNRSPLSQMISEARKFSPYRVYTASTPVVQVKKTHSTAKAKKVGKKKLS